jgi:hypothetical protein
MKFPKLLNLKPDREKLDEDKLREKLTELVNGMQEQRMLLGDKLVRQLVKIALKLERKKYKGENREEFDHTVRGHGAFQELCKAIGLKL